MRRFTSDGREIHLVNIFPGDVNIAHAGAGDATGLWDGQPFRMEITSATIGDQPSVEWQFKDWIYMAGGYMMYVGADFGDELTYDVYAPPSPEVGNVGAGAYTKQDVGGGLNRFVPGGGDWDVDMATAIPVPSSNEIGHFDWDKDTNVVSENANGKGKFDLFDAEIVLSKFVPRAQLLGGAKDTPIIIQMTVPAVKTKRLLAQWKHRVLCKTAVAKSSGAPLQIVWNILLGRKNT